MTSQERLFRCRQDICPVQDFVQHYMTVIIVFLAALYLAQAQENHCTMIGTGPDTASGESDVASHFCGGEKLTLSEGTKSNRLTQLAKGRPRVPYLLDLQRALRSL